MEKTTKEKEFIKMTSILFFAFIFSYSLIYSKKVHRNTDLFIFISAVIFILISTFRPHSGWGNDTSAYVNAYNDVITNPRLSMEVTFKIFAKLVYAIGNNVTVLFFIYALISVSIKAKIIKNTATFPLLSWLIYISCWYILHDMYQIRVGASIAFFLLSLPYLQEKQTKKYILCALISVLFHTQSLILFPLYFIANKKIDGKTVFIYECILIISYLFYFLHLDILSIILQILTKFNIPRVEQLRYYYAISQNGNFNLGKVNAFSPIVIIRLFLTVFLLHSYKNLNNKPLYPVCIRISMVSFAIRMFFYAIPVIAMRVYEYLSVVEIFLLPLLLFVVKEKKVMHLLIFGYCIFFILLRLRTA